MDRVSDFESAGCEFESHVPHQKIAIHFEWRFLTKKRGKHEKSFKGD